MTLFSDLLKLLEEIQKNPSKVLTSQHFTSDQSIQYNSDKKCFESEDGTYLGNTPTKVIEFLSNLVLRRDGDWIITAEWVIKDK